jgi:hypothetical protein
MRFDAGAFLLMTRVLRGTETVCRGPATISATDVAQGRRILQSLPAGIEFALLRFSLDPPSAVYIREVHPWWL